jgi:AcrR family transcriptional regulator
MFSMQKLRRDAERNRALILEAARQAFAEEGLRVTLDEIARRAGVGVGTVYRRFADKEALVEALFEQRVGEIVELGHTALAEEDEWDGVVCWIEGMFGLVAADRGLAEVLTSTAYGREHVAEAREQIAPLATQILERAQKAGRVRPDLRPGDFPMLNFMIGRLADYTRGVAPDLWRRYVTLFLDAVRGDGELSPLPVPALDIEQVAAVMEEKGL